jgi:protein-disulfide isomerase
MAAFRRCVDEDQVARVLVGDLMQATQNRINSTPTFVLNETEVLTGALPFAEFQKRIEAALATPRP